MTAICARKTAVHITETMSTEATAYAVGFLFLAVSDGLWTNFAIPRFYTSVKSGDMITRLISGSNLRTGTSPMPEIYTEVPTVENKGLRLLLFFINCSIPPALISEAVKKGVSGANFGAILGFYVYYVFNASSMTISSWTFRDAVLDTLYGVISLIILGLIVEEILL